MAKHIFFQSGERQRFLTLASYQRARILQEHVETIIAAWREVERQHGVELICWAVLPDHIHVVLDQGFNPTAKIVHAYRLETARLFHATKVAGRTKLWESQFWDQPLANKEALDRHIDFVHYNPVKHGLAGRPWDYPHSSFREFVKHGYYFKDWTLTCDRRRELAALDKADVG